MIVIPMAGLSSRFTKAGYTSPKYMLPIGDETVFSCSVESFRKYFKTEHFLFIARNVHNTYEFIIEQCDRLSVSDYEIVMLDHPTAGQAETVEQGLKLSQMRSDDSLGIFNIDTFRPNFCFPEDPWFSISDGYLEVFHGSGQNWSYVEPDKSAVNSKVIRTAEKQPISDLCCDGFYYFSSREDFLWSLECERINPSMPELYIAPLYNHLIKKGKMINYKTIDKQDVIFCGIPEEYKHIINSTNL